MKRVLVAGVLGALLLLGTPTLASSADHHRGGGNDRHDHDGYSYSYGYGYNDYYGYGYNDYYGPYGGPAYYYGRGYECRRDASGSATCEPYGGDWDPGGYNGGYADPPPDPSYCANPHSAHSARCQ
jgi:hypothetical protein